MSLKRFKEMDYYEMLGIERSASEDEVRDRYKEIAKVYHPDSQFFSDIVDIPVSNDDLEIFKLVTCAYNTLINKKKREEYDREHPPTSFKFSESIIPPNVQGWDAHRDPFVVVKPRTQPSSVAWNSTIKRNVKDIPEVQSVSEVMHHGIRRPWLGIIGILCGLGLIATGGFLLLQLIKAQ